jgi:hypothetical protein
MIVPALCCFFVHVFHIRPPARENQRFFVQGIRSLEQVHKGSVSPALSRRNPGRVAHIFWQLTDICVTEWQAKR